MTQQADGNVVEINPSDGTIIRTIVDDIDNATGIVGLPGLGPPFGDRLFVSQAGGILNVILRSGCWCEHDERFAQ